MKKTILRKYANLIATVGVNIQKGQEVIIQAELDQPEFVRMVVKECYRAGASKVMVEWGDQEITKYHYQYRTTRVLSHMEEWEIAKWEHRKETLPCMIYLMSEDPDGLAGVNMKKMAAAQRAKMKIIKPIRDEMENKYQWCIAAVPGVAWAKKIFPGMPKNKAIEKLWEAILFTSRVDEDPVAAWEKHNASLAARCDYLNSLGIATLEYKSASGTDFRVGLMENGLFLAGGEYTLLGNFFNPNIPTEEVFTTPKRGEAEGIVYSSRPLSYNGKLIENFSIRFEGGKAVEVHAEKNEELLKEMIGMDEGAAFLGECALVPYSSPIRQSELLFYNTLFDENAACHLALGRGFNNCVRDYDQYTFEEVKAMGVNDSMIHEDFMIGTEDLSITAITRDGKRIPLFVDGEWAF